MEKTTTVVWEPACPRVAVIVQSAVFVFKASRLMTGVAWQTFDGFSEEVSEIHGLCLHAAV